MRHSHAQRQRRDMAAGIMLALFLFRAYVPAGFMPATGAPFMLEICPTGLPGATRSPHAHHHMAGHEMAGEEMGPPSSGGHASFDDCPFGCVPAAGPVSHWAAAVQPAQILGEPNLALEPVPVGVRMPRAHRARGPPALA